MGNINKWCSDWKFWLQIITIAVIAGAGWESNRQGQDKIERLEMKIERLERMDHEKTETLIRVEGKFDMLNRDNRELKDLIQRLEQRLESKKVVNDLGVTDPVVDGKYSE